MVAKRKDYARKRAIRAEERRAEAAARAKGKKARLSMTTVAKPKGAQAANQKDLVKATKVENF